MVSLTNEEKDLLQSLGYGSEDVFDGTAISGGIERGETAKRLRKNFVLRDPSRSQCTHRLTTRAGHCIFCNPANLAYQERYYSKGFVYIAGSTYLQLLKIGFTNDTATRIEKLNYDCVALSSDWELLFRVLTKDGGMVEQDTHRHLSSFASPREYIKDGQKQVSREVFECSFSTALNAISYTMQKNRLTAIEQPWRSSRFKLYN